MDDSWHYIDGLYCSNCGGKIREYFEYAKCEDCGQICISMFDGEYIGVTRANMPEEDSKTTPLPLYLHDEHYAVNGFAIGSDSAKSHTLSIECCNSIRMHHKELDIEFEFDAEKIENIDTIEINGHRFVRET